MKKRLFTFGTLLALMLLAAFLPGFSMKTFAREKIYTIEAVGDDFRSVFGENKPTTGLTLTVPSWGTWINRVLTQADLKKTTPVARDKLIVALSELQKAIEELLKAVKGVK